MGFLQTISNKMEPFKEHALEYMNGLLKQEEGPTTLTPCANCGGAAKLVLYRCRQCFHSPLLCAGCIRKAHLQQPLHVVEEWEMRRGFWKRVPLFKLDLILNLGHGGKKCVLASAEPRRINVMHEYGVHKVSFRFCSCPSENGPPKTPAVQLLEAGFWPGSWERTATAFTLDVMDQFELLSSYCHANPTDYCAYLRRRSDGTCPDDCPVRAVLCCCVRAADASSHRM